MAAKPTWRAGVPCKGAPSPEEFPLPVVAVGTQPRTVVCRLLQPDATMGLAVSISVDEGAEG